MRKNHRELRAIVKEAGLTLVDFKMTGGDHVALSTKAPNGTERKFFASHSSSDRRAQANNLAMMRRFARENPAPGKPVPGPHLVVVDEANTFKPLGPTIAELQAAGHLSPTTTLPETTMTTTTPKGSPRNQLTDAEKFRVYDWLKSADLAGAHTAAILAERATKATGVTVTPGNARGALAAVGRELPIDPAKRPKPATPNERILARAIVALMTGLGQEPSDDLRALAE